MSGRRSKERRRASGVVLPGQREPTMLERAIWAKLTAMGEHVVALRDTVVKTAKLVASHERRLAELVRRQDERDQGARCDYYATKRICPACRSVMVERTTVGVIVLPDTRNKARCLDCGWSGVVDELDLDLEWEPATPVKEA